MSRSFIVDICLVLGFDKTQLFQSESPKQTNGISPIFVEIIEITKRFFLSCFIMNSHDLLHASSIKKYLVSKYNFLS